MSNKPFETFAKFFSQNKHTYTLLLGSGLSFTPRLWESQDYSTLSDFYKFAGNISQGEYTTILEEHFKTLQLQDGYRCLAQLIQKGFFRAIFTTNIDRFLEKALAEVIPGLEQVKVLVRYAQQDKYIISSLQSTPSEQTIVCWLRGRVSEAYNAKLDDIKEFPSALKAIVKGYLSRDMILSGFISNADLDIRGCIPQSKWSSWYLSPDRDYQTLRSEAHLAIDQNQMVVGPNAEFNTFFCKLFATLHDKEKAGGSNILPPAVSQSSSSLKLPPTKDQLSTKPQEEQRDFFISYNSSDRQWAEWIAWQLDQAGYSLFIEAWDSMPGRNMILDLQQAASQCKRTIAVLSPDYLKAPLTQTQWAAAFVQDPTGEHQTLLPVRARVCEPTGILKAIIPIDLVGLDEAEAHRQLLKGVGLRSRKPDVSPLFPGEAVPKANLARNPLLPANPPYPQN